MQVKRRAFAKGKTRDKFRTPAKLQDGASCKNNQWLQSITVFTKNSILDV